MYFVNIIVLLIVFGFAKNEDSIHYEGDEHPKGHLKYFKRQIEECNIEEKDCQKGARKCWGYEENCEEGRDFTYPECKSKGYAESIEAQKKIFWEQCDFGYVKKYLKSLNVLCEAGSVGNSSLKCDSEWQYCEAKNLYLDFREKDFSGRDRYLKDFLGVNEIGGSCKLKKIGMDEKTQFGGELNSWNYDLRHYTSMEKNDIKCDITIKKPTIFMKLDSGFNLYHHFCDFLNLYASQHINGTFTTDVYIVFWDPTQMGYFDLFEDTWKAFTRHKTKNLSEFKGKRVCFKDAMFSLPPRMPFGLYYNTPIAQNCRGCKLFEAFNEHLTHRLGIKQVEFQVNIVRVTLLTRTTKYRKILNQEELIGAMKRVKGLHVTAVDYKFREMSFLQQMKHSYNTDILIGMHGAGLTHVLFQPHWAAVFEIYNTEDPNCYKDLANIRGVDYYTWENKSLLFQQDKGNHPQLGEHPKFTNYAFNIDEFMRILTKAIKSVLARKKKYQAQFQ